jgi:hypothetical protein
VGAWPPAQQQVDPVTGLKVQVGGQPGQRHRADKVQVQVGMAGGADPQAATPGLDRGAAPRLELDAQPYPAGQDAGRPQQLTPVGRGVLGQVGA